MKRRPAFIGAGVAVAVAVAIGVVVAMDEGNPTVVTAPSELDEGAPDLVEAGSAASAFPQVQSLDLNGDDVSLPDGLPGEVTVVLLSWGRAHQDPVDEWIEALAPIESEHEGVDHVQLAVTGRTDVATRGTVQFFMRQVIEDEDTRARTIPLFTNSDQFAEFVGADSTADAGLLLVHDGVIVWRHEGAHTPDAENLLTAEITALAG